MEGHKRVEVSLQKIHWTKFLKSKLYSFNEKNELNNQINYTKENQIS